MTIPTALAKLEQAKKVEQRGYAIADQLTPGAARDYRAQTRHEALSLRLEAVVLAAAVQVEMKPISVEISSPTPPPLHVPPSPQSLPEAKTDPYPPSWRGPGPRSG